MRSWVAAALCGICLLAGCQKLPPAEFRFNEVEWLKQERTHLADGEHFQDDYRRQIGNLTTALFGTPDEPKFPASPDDGEVLVALEHLQRAAGPASSDRQGTYTGLYRANCAHCHGISGDGAGATALVVSPYPRDFRLGKFKFKSTPLRRPPTDDDLTRVIRDGIPGTAMPSFRHLPDEDVQALVDYVKYLSIRGEFERGLIGLLADLDDEPLVDLALLEKLESASGDVDADSLESLDDQLFSTVGELLFEMILPRWAHPQRHIVEVPQPPAGVAPDDPQHAELVAIGRSAFYGKANCLQCHGDTGLGDGQQSNYDDWTNEWAKSPGVDPLVPETYQAFLKAGALPPRTVRPRNLNVPVYRGGSDWESLYRRIAAGIEGTPMPSSPTLTSDEIWALVAYVLSMPYEQPAR